MKYNYKNNTNAIQYNTQNDLLQVWSKFTTKALQYTISTPEVCGITSLRLQFIILSCCERDVLKCNMLVRLCKDNKANTYTTHIQLNY